MNKKKVSFYEILVNIAYGYFILLGLSFLSLFLFIGSTINYMALITVVVFALQIWFKHKLGNLIIGVVTFAASIFVMLEFLSRSIKAGFNSFNGCMTALFGLAMLFSGILIFSYTKFAFREQ